MKPYVVSADLHFAWQRYTNLSLPSTTLREFRDTSQRALESCFGCCDWVEESELADGLQMLTRVCDVPIISLDGVYTHQTLTIDITRAVNDQKEDVGLCKRNGSAVDLERLVAELAAQVSGTEAALLDDVIFSGVLLSQICDLFARHGISIVRAYAGIAIGEGIHRLSERGCPVQCVRRYDEVIDEICERDFLPGAPLSGRTIYGQDNVGMPYLLPFGNAEQWASFPVVQARELSRTILQAGINLYQQLPPIRCADLPRHIVGVPKNETLVTDALTQSLTQLL